MLQLNSIHILVIAVVCLCIGNTKKKKKRATERERERKRGKAVEKEVMAEVRTLESVIGCIGEKISQNIGYDNEYSSPSSSEIRVEMLERQMVMVLVTIFIMVLVLLCS